MADPIVERIATLPCPRGRLLPERRNHSYTLTPSGAPVARLRQTGRDDRVEVLYWSLWKERWISAGPFGRTILPLDDVSASLRQRTFSGRSSRDQRGKMREAQLGLPV